MSWVQTAKDCGQRQHSRCTCGYEAVLEKRIAVMKEALEMICDMDARPYRCLSIARDALDTMEKQS